MLYKKTFSCISLFFLTAFSNYSYSQVPDSDSVLIGKRKQPEILLFGTFHFAYYNLDAHKVNKEDQVDILSEKKQAELQELLNYIAKFKPTKIAVESGRNTGYLVNRYKRYRAGSHQLGKNEIEQVGFRMMQMFSLDTIYGVDDNELEADLYNSRDSVVLRPLLDSIYNNWQFGRDYGDSINMIYKNAYYPWKDKLSKSMPLLDYFKFFNDDHTLNRGNGAYLTGNFTIDDTRGADALSMHWYNRNLRIYRHIQQITTSPNDRILVIYGQGHITFLKYLFECSPQYRLIKFGSLK